MTTIIGFLLGYSLVGVFTQKPQITDLKAAGWGQDQNKGNEIECYLKGISVIMVS